MKIKEKMLLQLYLGLKVYSKWKMFTLTDEQLHYILCGTGYTSRKKRSRSYDHY